MGLLRWDDIVAREHAAWLRMSEIDTPALWHFLLKLSLLLATPKPIKVPLLMPSNPHFFALQHLLASKDMSNNRVSYMVSTASSINILQYAIICSTVDSLSRFFAVLLQLHMAVRVHFFGFFLCAVQYVQCFCICMIVYRMPLVVHEFAWWCIF